jgi:hypothetical protein
MEKQIYLIRTYNMIGQTFKTWEKSSYNESDLIIRDNSIRLKNASGFPYCFSLSFEKEGIEYEQNGLLDYKATVIQDFFRHFSFEPEKYMNCQLMMQTHGGYLQFKDLDTSEVHRIAINSNYYEKN